MKKHNAKTLEVLLIAGFVAIVTVAFWGQISIGIKNLVGMSAVNKTNVSGTAGWLAIQAQFEALLAQLKQTPSDLNKRTETVGTLGDLIANYKNYRDMDLYNALIGYIKDLAALDGNSVNAEACVASPSSCTTLMTITDFNWGLSNKYGDINMNTIYSPGNPEGHRIPVELEYSYQYIDDNGVVRTKILKQEVEIQKEQNPGKYNQPYSAFLNDYMATKFSSDMFTGSGTNVQNIIDQYMTGDNCELSKSKSEYIIFSEHGLTEPQEFDPPW